MTPSDLRRLETASKAPGGRRLRTIPEASGRLRVSGGSGRPVSYLARNKPGIPW